MNSKGSFYDSSFWNERAEKVNNYTVYYALHSEKKTAFHFLNETDKIIPLLKGIPKCIWWKLEKHDNKD